MTTKITTQKIIALLNKNTTYGSANGSDKTGYSVRRGWNDETVEVSLHVNGHRNYESTVTRLLTEFFSLINSSMPAGYQMHIIGGDTYYTVRFIFSTAGRSAWTKSGKPTDR